MSEQGPSFLKYVATLVTEAGLAAGCSPNVSPVNAQSEIDKQLNPNQPTSTEVMTAPPTQTPLPTEIAVMASPTPEQKMPPTLEATAAPVEASVIPDGAVKTADGASVFVENGKVYKIDASRARTETELSREVFTDVFEAGDLVKQLHPELFEGDQKELLDFLLPANTYKDGLYDHSVIGYRWSRSKEYDSWDADITGKALELIRLKTPDGFPEGQEAGVLMLAVYGLKEPFPVLATMEKNGKTTVFFEHSRTFDLYKQRNNMIYDSSKNYQNASDLAADLINQRIRDVFPVGVAGVSDAYLDDAFYFRKDDDLAVSLEKYQSGKYGAVIHNMVPEIKKGFAQKLPTGAMFDKILDRFKSDPEFRSGFVGFMSRLPWAEKYKAE